MLAPRIIGATIKLSPLPFPPNQEPTTVRTNQEVLHNRSVVYGIITAREIGTTKEIPVRLLVLPNCHVSGLAARALDLLGALF